MKKHFLVLIGIIGLMSIFAQNRLNIHLKSINMEKVAISTIDSMYFDENDTILTIRLLNQSVTQYPISSIDSLTFSDTVTFLPTVKTIKVDNIVQNAARSGVNLFLPGASPVTVKGICWSTEPNPTLKDSIIKNQQTFKLLYFNMSPLIDNTTYYVRAYATNSFGTSYGECLMFTTPAYTPPVVVTSSVINTGGFVGTCTGYVSSSGGYKNYTARGFCWSTGDNPTLADQVVVHSTVLIGSYSLHIAFPTSGLTYYVRAYATNEKGTSYGTVMSIKPSMGNLTYTIDTGTLPVGTANYNLIKIAMDSAMYYYNRYATFTGNIWVYYDQGIPTAQASNHGSIGFGKETGYMHVCTAMHETAHWLGSGTTTVWQNLTVNGVYTGAAATAMLRSLTGNPSGVLYGDDQHFWPYGLNYRSEVTSANDYIFHAKIVNAMKTDCGW